MSLTCSRSFKVQTMSKPFKTVHHLGSGCLEGWPSPPAPASSSPGATHGFRACPQGLCTDSSACCWGVAFSLCFYSEAKLQGPPSSDIFSHFPRRSGDSFSPPQALGTRSMLLSLYYPMASPLLIHGKMRRSPSVYFSYLPHAEPSMAPKLPPTPSALKAG